MISVLIAFALAQSAAGASALVPAFGNTLVSTYPDGRTARLWLAADGTYSGASRSGRASSGVWTVKAEEICLRQRRPVPMPMTYCTPIVTGGVGTAWTARAVTGERITVTLVADQAFTALRRMSLMRLCQPGPVSRNRSMTT